MRVKAFWCVRDIDNDAKWRALELYLLLIILIMPAVAMTFSYGTIIRTVCQVVTQRRTMTMNYGKKGYKQKKQDEVLNDAAEQSSRPMMFEEATVVLENELEGIPLDSVIIEDEENGAAAARKAVVEKHEKDQNNKKVELDEETKQVVRMLISIVVVYIICWAPLLTFNLIQSFGYIDTHLMATEKHLKTAFSLMAYVNSCLNPIIYGFMSKNFRNSFRNQIRFCVYGRNAAGDANNASIAQSRRL